MKIKNTTLSMTRKKPKYMDSKYIEKYTRTSINNLSMHEFKVSNKKKFSIFTF